MPSLNNIAELPEEDRNFLNKAEEIAKKLVNNGELANEILVSELCRNIQDMSGKYNEIMQAERNLKLGIVGRVKAGKSSFLNALLFKGQDILPKAATPMTAALTSIKYAEKREEQKAIVYFYTREEWERIEDTARQYDDAIDRIIEYEEQEKAKKPNRSPISDTAQHESEEEKRARIERTYAQTLPEDLRGCHELVRMAQKNGLHHSGLPATGIEDSLEISGSMVEDVHTFVESLSDYVGSHGKYTPMVKRMELQIHDEGLAGLEIYDTPGLNDPVSSRVAATNAFLKESDAVLLLSSVSHFLDAGDAELLSKKLAGAGIKRAYIVGTMMDVGVREYNPRKPVTLNVAYKESKKAYIKQARSVLDAVEKVASLPDNMLSQQYMPEFVSSVMYAIARKKAAKEDLEPKQDHLLEQLGKIYPDYDKELATTNDFYNFAGFGSFDKKVYQNIKAEKEVIIQEKIANFKRTQALDIMKALEQINILALNNMHKLEHDDINSLKEKMRNTEDCLNESRFEVQSIFQNIANDCKRSINSVKINIFNALSGYKHIKIETDVQTKEYSTGWWVFKNYHHETVKTRRAQATDVANNIEAFVAEAQRLANDELVSLFDIKGLDNRLRKAIAGAFEASGTKFSNADILGPVQELIAKLEVPNVNFDFVAEAKKNIFNKFSSDVINDDIARLTIMQDEQLDAVLKKIHNDLDAAGERIKNVMVANSTTFVDNLSKKISDNYGKIVEQLGKREEFLVRYRNFAQELTGFKKDMEQFTRC